MKTMRMKTKYCFICIILLIYSNLIVCRDINSLIKTFEVGWQLGGYSVSILTHISFENCLGICASTKRCEALNYKPRFRICELKNRRKNSGIRLTESIGSLYAEIADWRQSKFNKCDPEVCYGLQQCLPAESGQECINTNCWWTVAYKECASVDRSNGVSVNSKVTYRCYEGYQLIGRSAITCQTNGVWSEPRFECKAEAFDCKDIQKQGKTSSGVYKIAPIPCQTKYVLCDMDEEGGGWTVLSRRINNSTNFNQTWKMYKDGFGVESSNHWIGNDYIHRLTKDRSVDVLFVFEHLYGGRKYHFQYRNFTVEDEEQKYALSFDSGPLYLDFRTWNGLLYMHICDVDDGSSTCQDGTPFSTYDSDNTGNASCPTLYGGGWWFGQGYCSGVCLTGEYVHGYFWSNQLGFHRQLNLSTIMIRPT